MIDEADAIEVSAEGDPITLAERRTLSFGNRKIIVGGTPLIEATSHVCRSYGESDQRVFEVPCPPAVPYGDPVAAHRMGAGPAADGALPLPALRDLDRREAQAGDGQGRPWRATRRRWSDTRASD